MAKASKNNIVRDCWNIIGIWASVRTCDLLDEYVHCRNCPVFQHAGRSVFELSPPAGYMTQWNKELATEQKEAKQGDSGIVVFRVSGEWYAFSAKVVEEIASYRHIHRIPRNENPYLLGIVNIGGEINISYSLASILNVNNAKTAEATKTENEVKRLVVVKVKERNYVFPVDEVKGLARYYRHSLINMPATIESHKSNLLLGLTENDGLQIAVINETELCLGIERMSA